MENEFYITRFNLGKGTPKRADKQLCDASNSLEDQTVTEQLERNARLLMTGPSPSGVNFGTWTGGSNKRESFGESYGIMLEYHYSAQDVNRVEQLTDAFKTLGYTHFFFTSENKKGNTLTFVLPLLHPVSFTQYARIAGILAYKIDSYDMAEGCLAATHIAQLHATSLACWIEGKMLNPSTFIELTRDSYQEMNATKYEGRPRVKAEVVEEVKEVVDGLFSYTETVEEARLRKAEEVMRTLGFVG